MVRLWQLQSDAHLALAQLRAVDGERGRPCLRCLCRPLGRYEIGNGRDYHNSMTAPVAFLFLGETLLIPHLFPIAEALAAAGVQCDLWVSTSVHEALLGRWAASEHIRIRRAPGFLA